MREVSTLRERRREVSEAGFYVGQKVILRTPRGGSRTDEREVTVTKVGRKYVYTDAYTHDLKFDIDSGDEIGAARCASRIGTAEMFAQRDRLAAARHRAVAVVSDYSWHRNLTVEQLNQIADMIEGSKK